MNGSQSSGGVWPLVVAVFVIVSVAGMVSDFFGITPEVRKEAHKAAQHLAALRVHKVVDANRVQLRADGTTTIVRLVGLRHVKKDFCAAEPIKRELEDLLPAGAVVKSRGDAKWSKRHKSGVLISTERDGLVQLELIKRGYARVAKSSFGRRAEFVAAEQRARESGVGLWSSCSKRRAR